MTARAIHNGSDGQNGYNASPAHFILHRLFKKYLGAFTIRLWDNSEMVIGKDDSAFTLTVRSPKVLRDLVLFRDPLRLAEAYFDGAVEVAGDFNMAMGLRYYLENIKLPFQEKLVLVIRALALKNEISQLQPSQNKAMTKKPSHVPRQNGVESIAFHYDVSNEFYQLWLDERMVYSCAYFESPEQDINQAQRNKLNYICRKLRLQPGESLLDIGCGWGALVCWAAKHYGVRAHGITLSRNQYEYASEEVKRLGLQDQVTIEMCDYRDLPREATYNKVSSIGMFEHVGLKIYLTTFQSYIRCLSLAAFFLIMALRQRNLVGAVVWRPSLSIDMYSQMVN